MKQFYAITILTTFVSFSAHARIGESIDQLSQRYGQAEKVDNNRLPTGEKYEYIMNPFRIEVVTINGKSVMEIIHRSVEPAINDNDIKDLLTANGDVHAWSYDRKTNQWLRSDRKVRAFREPGHPGFLFIEDVAATDQARAKNGKGKLNGF